MSMISRSELLQIYHDNLTHYYDTRFKVIPPSEYFKSSPDKPDKIESRYKQDNVVEVVNSDTIECASTMIEDGYHPAVLNMASDMVPGGGWKRGALAQEECLFYRSNYALTVDPFLQAKYRLRVTAERYYPMGTFSAIYSPGVTIMRNQRLDILDWDKCFKLDFIAVAALRRPKLNSNDQYTFTDSYIMTNKIRGILRLAIAKGHDSVVLGALGCGEFRCPASETAHIFKQVLSEPEFEKNLRLVRFAILNGGTTNYEIFKNIL